MAAHAQAKQRVHTHKGVDFIVVPGSKRERVLLDLFQSEDRLAARPVEFFDPPAADTPWLVPVGALLIGFGVGVLAGWLI